MSFSTPPTLAALLRKSAAQRPDAPAYVFLRGGDDEAGRWTLAQVEGHAAAVAGALRRAGVTPGDRVVLPFPPGLEFLAAFFGTVYAGAIPAPVPPPHPYRREQEGTRLRAVCADATPAVVLTTAKLCPAVARALAGDGGSAPGPNEHHPAILSIEEALREAPWRGAEPAPHDLALLQYTSGSTAAPKGVMVSHANLLHNLRAVQAAGELDADSTVVTWLPHFHDLGLIGMLLNALHAGAPCVMLPPFAVLQSPVRWLRAISRYGGVTSAAPNFGYEWCARQVRDAELADIDLGTWKVAVVGAEPTRATTLRAFAARFGPCGFRWEAFCPGYGLAEHTLMATGTARHAPPIVHSALPREAVGCGQLWLDGRLLIVDAETRVPRPPGSVGEIWLAGAGVAAGYWGRPEKTTQTFAARLASGDGPFLRTGDLGFLDGEELFVTGRIKDLIIIGGSNHDPHEIERTAEEAHPAVRFGGAAAFGIEVESEERPVVVAEIERDGAGDPPDVIAAAISHAVARRHGMRLHHVLLVPAGHVPKTSSGKVRRAACQEAYLGGTLPPVR